MEQATEGPGKEPGRKFDGGKDRWDLVPVGAMRRVVRVLGVGAKRYGDDNWKRVEGARQRYYAAALRHLTAWWEGEAADADTGESHLAHTICCLLFLLATDLDTSSAPAPAERLGEAPFTPGPCPACKASETQCLERQVGGEGPSVVFGYCLGCEHRWPCASVPAPIVQRFVVHQGGRATEPVAPPPKPVAASPAFKGVRLKYLLILDPMNPVASLAHVSPAEEAELDRILGDDPPPSAA